ncbi:hypothetical protein [Mucilaginibacter gracilis]|nr:hypothetical protein [Mucilaginibacter gracilis]
MAGIQLKITMNPKGRVRASSILEVIISMVVIVIVFSIAMAIFANVQRLSLSAKKIRAEAVLKEELIKIAEAPQLSKQSSTVDGLSIEEETTSYNNNDNLFQVNLTAYDANKEKVAELKEVIYDAR